MAAPVLVVLDGEGGGGNLAVWPLHLCCLVLCCVGAVGEVDWDGVGWLVRCAS